MATTEAKIGRVMKKFTIYEQLLGRRHPFGRPGTGQLKTSPCIDDFCWPSSLRIEDAFRIGCIPQVVSRQCRIGRAGNYLGQLRRRDGSAIIEAPSVNSLD